MILYLDASSLVKLYVSEDGSDEVWRLVAEASLFATSVLAYPEARSAFARLRREQAVTAREAERLKADLEKDWPRYLALDVGEPVWRRAGDLAERHALRGFDSLHLALLPVPRLRRSRRAGPVFRLRRAPRRGGAASAA